MKKNILIVTSGFPLWETEGLSAFMLEFANALSGDFEVYVLAPFAKPSKRYEKIGKVTVYRHSQFPFMDSGIGYKSGIMGNIRNNPLLIFTVPFYFLLQIAAIYRIVRKHHIDIINAHWIIPQGVTAVLYKKFFNPKIKVLSTIQGSDYLTLNSSPGKFLKRFVLNGSDGISAVSQSICEALHKNGYSKPVYYYPWGVDTKKFSPENKSPELLKKYNAVEGLLLYVGGIIEGKGIRFLIDAMRDIAKKYPLIKLLIIGEGYLEEEMKKKCRELSISENVIFAGVIPNQDLPPYFASANIFILPSFSEGYPAVVREALSSGAFTVVTDLPVFNSFPEFEEILFKVKIRNSEDISEKILYILNNSGSLSHIKQKGRDFILKTSGWKIFKENYRRVFENL